MIWLINKAIKKINAIYDNGEILENFSRLICIALKKTGANEWTISLMSPIINNYDSK